MRAALFVAVAIACLGAALAELYACFSVKDCPPCANTNLAPRCQHYQCRCPGDHQCKFDVECKRYCLSYQFGHCENDNQCHCHDTEEQSCKNATECPVCSNANQIRRCHGFKCHCHGENECDEDSECDKYCSPYPGHCTGDNGCHCEGKPLP